MTQVLSYVTVLKITASQESMIGQNQFDHFNFFLIIHVQNLKTQADNI